MDALIIAILLIVTFSVGFRTGWVRQINYKKRWQEAIGIIKKEKMLSGELEEIEPPMEVPERLKNLPFTPSYGNEHFKNLTGDQREDMEMLRLNQGLPPKDSMGGTPADVWTRVRKAQLRRGWEHFDTGFYKVK